MTFIIILGIIVSILIFALIYINTSSQFGVKPSNFNSSDNFRDGKFHNLIATSISSEDVSFFKSLANFIFRKSKDAYPHKTLDTISLDKDRSNDDVSITWLGHSTVLMTSKDLVILTDPVLGNKKMSPLNLGPKPFPYRYIYKVEDLPKIDIVLISHDHFDHLDLATIKQLKDSVFYVPLGVKGHLLRWGIDNDQIHELDWYDEKNYSDNLKLTFAPSRHFSGRNPFHRDTTLWGSWLINLNDKTLYFGGDSGYFDEFKTMGEKFGKIDIAMLDTGQYNKAWHNIHMFPEESIQAAIDLKAQLVMPIHNSKYVLSLHAWYEPLDRFFSESKKKKVNIATPQIGQTFILGKDTPNTKWWSNDRK